LELLSFLTACVLDDCSVDDASEDGFDAATGAIGM
jgi:hypothetical protein